MPSLRIASTQVGKGRTDFDLVLHLPPSSPNLFDGALRIFMKNVPISILFYFFWVLNQFRVMILYVLFGKRI